MRMGELVLVEGVRTSYIPASDHWRCIKSGAVWYRQPFISSQLSSWQKDAACLPLFITVDEERTGFSVNYYGVQGFEFHSEDAGVKHLDDRGRLGGFPAPATPRVRSFP